MILNISGFQMCQGPKNTKGPEYAKVLNIPGLERFLNVPEYLWIIPKDAWFYLNNPEY